MTLAIATGELLRRRPHRQGIALEIVRPGKAPVLWHVVSEDEVARRVAEWRRERGLEPACSMCGSTAGDHVAEDGLVRCIDCGCH